MRIENKIKKIEEEIIKIDTTNEYNSGVAYLFMLRHELLKHNEK